MEPKTAHGNRRLVEPPLAKETEMHRYCLTFDANPKELVRRDAGGSHVALLWSRRRRRAAVVVEEDATGEVVQLDIRDRENPLELFQHPYAYLTTRGHPGKHCPPAGTMRGPTRPTKEVSSVAKKAHDRRDLRKDRERDR
jgi:hypothetical protein